MNLTIKYQLSEAGQKASLLAGGNGKAEQLVSGEITPEELSHPLISINLEGSLRTIGLNNCTVDLYVPGWKRPEWNYVRPDPFDAPLDFDSAWDLAKKFSSHIDSEMARLQPEYDAAVVELKEGEAREKAEQKARDERNREQAEQRIARKEAQESALKQWGQEHGSCLLKARIEDGFEWQSLSRREYADNVLASVGLPPGLLWSDCEDRERPTLEEIRVLRQYREALGDRAHVALAWYSPTEVDDSGYPSGDQPAPATALAVDVKTPDGQKVNRIIPWDQLPK